MLKFINKSYLYLLTLAILFIQNVNGTGEKSSCHLYGHSCLGAHGKRSSNEQSQSIASKLVSPELDKYPYQIPSLEHQLMNSRIYNRLIGYMKNGNDLSTSSTSNLPFEEMNTVNSIDSLLAQFNQLSSLDRQLLGQNLKSKRFETDKLNFDDQSQHKTFLKKSNDFVNRLNNIKRISNDLYDGGDYTY